MTGRVDARRWLCRCDCGTERPVYGFSLRRGDTTSCGCGRNVTHGKSKDPSSLYQTWENIKQRTTNPRNGAYRNYGARGIALDPRWGTFAAFEEGVLAEIGPRPSGTTLDRIDVDGDYAPGNVRWATWREQMQNRRDARWRTGEACSFPDCGRRRSAHGLCQSHRRQQVRGEELRPVRAYTREAP